MQQRLSSNLTDDQWLSAYYRYYKYDLNNKTIPNATKSQHKPSLDIRLKSKRRKFEQQKYQQQTINSVHPEKFINVPSTLPSPVSTTIAIPKDITTATTAASTLKADGGTIGTVETTTAGITKSIDKLPANNNYVIAGTHTTPEIDTNAKINNRMNVNDGITTNGIWSTTLTTSTTTTTPLPIPSHSTTEHSITYNVTVNDDLKRVQPMHRPKSRRISNAGWGRWQKWTKCSRSCGGGVMSQSRFCLSR